MNTTALPNPDPAVKHYLDTFANSEKKLPGNQLPWLQQQRQTALQHFAQHGFPNFHDEDWKYTSTTPITKHQFKLAPAPLADTLASAITLAGVTAEPNSQRLVFINGHFVAKLSTLGNIKSGVIIGSIAQILQNEPTAIQTHLGKYCDDKSIGFTGLNTTLFQDGAYIYLSDDTVFQQAIELLFISTAQTEQYITPIRNLIIAAKNSRATIIENYVSLDQNNHFTNTVTELLINEHASIEHYKILQENDRAFHIGTLQVEQLAHSQFTSHSFAFGGALVRSDINVNLAAEYAECTLNGLYVLNDQQHVDHHTLINHAKPHGTSRENYKGVITDHGRAVFNGKVLVQPDAQKTNAQQSNKNLLLSENAEIDTKPQLEIYADDVQCTHGATVGQLDDNALFYLRSRGIDEVSARGMLINAFALDMLEKVSLTSLREQLQKKLSKLI